MENPLIRTVSYWSCSLYHDWKIFRWCSWAWFTALYNGVLVTIM